MSKTKGICLTALGIALYVVVSMSLKIPTGIGHLALDLGYVVLAVYCYIYGGVSGAIVGACGCFLVSLISTGWIAIGWPLGNLLVGALCGVVYNRTKDKKWAVPIGMAVTVVAVFIGVGVIKTVVECAMYSLPLGIKFAKNMVAFAMDAAVMCAGFLFARKCAGRMNFSRISKRLPEPDTMLIVDAVDDNSGKTYTGAAMRDQSGDWYWIFDGAKSSIIPYRIQKWWYMNKK